MAFYRLYMVTRPGPGPTLSFFWCYLHHLYWYPINIIKYYQWYLQHFFGLCIYIYYMDHLYPIGSFRLQQSSHHIQVSIGRCRVNRRPAVLSVAVRICPGLAGKNGGLSLISLTKKRGFYQENIWSLAIEKHLPWIRIVSPKDRDLRDINIEI